MVSSAVSADHRSNLATNPSTVVARSNHEDAAVAEAAMNRLRTQSYEGLRSITCEYHEGMLILRGIVSTYYLKQLAQEIAHKIQNVNMIVNAVEVADLQQVERQPAKPD